MRTLPEATRRGKGLRGAATRRTLPAPSAPVHHAPRPRTLVTTLTRLLLAILLLCAPAAAQPARPLDVMTFNLRFAHTTPPNLWPQRRPVVRALVQRWAPDVIGTQEGLYAQLADMQADLPAYAWIGLGRDGGSHGEFMAVFYRRDRLTPLEYDHFWLSDTPATIASRTWGNDYPRMVTWVRFRDRASGRDFYFVNTHFDHEVQLSRERGAELMLRRMAGFDSALPVVLVGDFNVDAGANPVYTMLTESGGFADAWRALGKPEPAFGTFHDFKGVAGAKGSGRIDWILTRNGAAAVSTEIVTFARGGQLPSDHFPVAARVRLGSAAGSGKRGAGTRR